MNDIHVFIIDQSFKADTTPTGNGFEYCVDAIHRQAKTLGVSYELDIVKKNELPSTVSSKMVSIFADNAMILPLWLCKALQYSRGNYFLFFLVCV